MSISGVFDVTTDYLLGKSDIPDVYYIDAKSSSEIQKTIYGIMKKRNVNRPEFYKILNINEALFEQKLIHDDFTIREITNKLRLLDCKGDIRILSRDIDKDEAMSRPQ